jgi:hypothetical protein
MTSSNVSKLIELKTRLKAMPRLQPIDGWMGYAVNSKGEVLAGKWEADGTSITNKFKPEGEWKKHADKIKLQDEFRFLFASISDADFKEYLKLVKET